MSKSSSTNVNIPSNYDIQLGGDGTTIKSDTGIELEVKKPIVVHTKSESDSKSKADLKIDTDSKVDVKIEPLKVDTDSKIDVKPLAVDTCTTVKLAPLPATRVEQPYHTHFGFTYMGMELFGFNMSGKSGMFLSSPPKSQYHSMEPAEPHRPPCDEPRAKEHQGHPRSGLRVRINDR
jgi:hypothetical protein